MKYYPAVFSVILLCLIFTGLEAQEQEPQVVEEVGVNWWLVPVMAVDSAGNPITDLKPEDITVRLNNSTVTGFTFIKSAFTSIPEVPVGEVATVPEGIKPKVPLPEAVEVKPVTGLDAGRVVFLLFDLAMSRSTSTGRSKRIARSILADAQPGTRFVLMRIMPFSGLQYVTQGFKNDAKLLEALDKQIIIQDNDRLISKTLTEISHGGDRRGNRLVNDDIKLRRREAATYYTRKSVVFFKAFKSLYLHLNGLEESKFVYFFSEGVPNEFQSAIPGGHSFYTKNLKEIANYLGRSGAMLFLVNALGVDEGSDLSARESGNDPIQADESAPVDKILTFDALASGHSFLNALATESGGKYLEGTKEKITEQIRNLHRAYYEVSFPDSTEAKGLTRSISISSNRKGVKIVSLHSIERKKPYSSMSALEKELTALNLVTGNPLVRRRVKVFNAALLETKTKKKGVTYTLWLPPDFRDKKLDLYKISLLTEGPETTVKRIEKESLTSAKNSLKVFFPAQATDKGTVRDCFVLVEPNSDGARVLGPAVYPDSPEYMVWMENKETATLNKNRKGKGGISDGELVHILAGAAAYCDRLKLSAFHFFCQEGIVETRIPLTKAESGSSAESMRDRLRFTLPAQMVNSRSMKDMDRVYKYKFSYRLLKNGADIKEEREWLSSHDNVRVGREKVAAPRAFFSEKAVFAPITLLAKDRQQLYHYSFLRYDRLKGRRTAVIEVIPKNPDNGAPSVYGDVWIDMEDFTVLKIKADPRSIVGYLQLKELAKKLNTRLFLSLETEFGMLSGGIRFPTRVLSLEQYKGGQLISQFKRSKPWERARTEFTYSDYQFFNVKTDVSIE